MIALPAWLTRFLPHILIVGAVLFGVWYIGHLGEKRAEDRLERERLEEAIMWEKQVRRIESAVTTAVTEIDAKTGERLAVIDVTNRTIIQPTIEKEIRREVRLSDPALGLPPGLLEALNTARNLSDTSGPARSVTVALPSPEPVE